jgi:hypothetical protein
MFGFVFEFVMFWICTGFVVFRFVRFGLIFFICILKNLPKRSKK